MTQTQKRVTPSKEEEAEEEPPSSTAERNAKLKKELDAVLDEIDAVLDDNAETFVKEFVQKGGE
jgi:ubiquitin-like protein Pup